MALHNGLRHNGESISTILELLKTVDGSGSGLDADSLDGTLTGRATAANAKDTTNNTTILTPSSLLDVSAMRALFTLTSADLNSTADQTFTKVGTFTSYVIFAVLVFNSSGNANTAAGGIYTAASKGGGVIVAASQNYAGMTGSGGGTACTVAAGTANSGRSINTATPILSLTTPQGSAMTADFYIMGFPLT